MKKYNIKIIFEDGCERESKGTANNLDEICDIYLSDKAIKSKDGKKLMYYNRKKIMALEVEEIGDEENE